MASKSTDPSSPEPFPRSKEPTPQPSASRTGSTSSTPSAASSSAAASSATTAPASQAKQGKQPKQALPHSRAGSWWTALIIGAALLIVLLVFILQNLDSHPIQILFWQWEMPLGVALLGAAILGVLITATIGGIRILQLRRQARKGLR